MTLLASPGWPVNVVVVPSPVTMPASATVNVRLAGVASVLPAWSVARTWNVWEPGARPQ